MTRTVCVVRPRRGPRRRSVAGGVVAIFLAALLPGAGSCSGGAGTPAEAPNPPSPSADAEPSLPPADAGPAIDVPVPLDPADADAALQLAEELVALSLREERTEELASVVDWAFAATMAGAHGAPFDDAAKGSWLRHLWAALRKSCPRRPLTVERYQPGAAGGYFDPPAGAGGVAGAEQQEAFAEVERGLGESLLVSTPCDRTLEEDGFELLVGRDAEGRMVVRGFRYLERVRPLLL
jgi:hypothetical protein